MAPIINRPLSLFALREANIKRQAERRANHMDGSMIDAEFRCIEFSGEAGEVADAFKKHLRWKRGIEGKTATLRDIADEMGDTLITLDLLAMELGIDLAAAVQNKFNESSDALNLNTKLHHINSETFADPDAPEEPEIVLGRGAVAGGALNSPTVHGKDTL